jgi:hypothetical protein
MKVRLTWLRRAASSAARVAEIRCGSDVLARMRVPPRDRLDDLASELDAELGALGEAEREITVAILDAGGKALAVTTLQAGKRGGGIDVRNERTLATLALRYAEGRDRNQATRESAAHEREESLYRALLLENDRLRKRIDVLEERNLRGLERQEELASMAHEREMTRYAEENRVAQRGEALKSLVEFKDKAMAHLARTGAAKQLGPRVAALVTQIQRVAPGELATIVGRLDADGVKVLEQAISGFEPEKKGGGKGVN